MNAPIELLPARLEPSLNAVMSSAPQRRLSGNVLASVGLADRHFLAATAVGDVFIAFNRFGVSAVERAQDAPDFESEFELRYGRRTVETAKPPIRLVRTVDAMLEGKRVQPPEFDLRPVTSFQQSVLRKAIEIPFGQVRPYGWIAKEIGHPLAQRAVGTALARNPIPLLIPCHRVVRNDGIIGNYGMGGTAVKKALLASEGLDPEQLEALARRGFRYLGSDSTGIFCYPTCGHAARVTDAHRLYVRNGEEAFLMGLRPCKRCRPPAP